MVPMPPTYLDILANSFPLKLEVYSGDDDDNCPTLGSMQWSYALHLEATSKWAPWYYQDAVYGATVGTLEPTFSCGVDSWGNRMPVGCFLF
jgi:hypothetical protein